MGWYVVPAEGTMRGFRNFFHEADANQQVMIVQTLSTTNLKPGADYAIWFSFKSDTPARLTFWLRFASPASTPGAFKATRTVLDPAPAD